MSLFQRIKTPFAESAEAAAAQPEWRANQVGQMLRERRQAYGLDLDSVGEALRIKAVYLDALEQGRTQDLPGPTYAIGFVRTYAQYLGLDPERMLEHYKAESADVHLRPDLSLPVPLGERSLPGMPVLLVGLIVALCGYGTWYYLSTGERSRPERVTPVPAELRREATLPAPPPAASAAPAKPEPLAEGRPLGSGLTVPSPLPPPTALAVGAPQTVAAVPETPRDVVNAPPPAAAAGAASAGETAPDATGQIDIRALADCWIQVRAAADQSIVFSRVLKAGETYRVPRPGLLLRTGNAGALAIAVDGKPAPAIGPVGAMRRSVELDPKALLAGTAAHG